MPARLRIDLPTAPWRDRLRTRLVCEPGTYARTVHGGHAFRAAHALSAGVLAVELARGLGCGPFFFQR
ncbi:hypothetical protein XFF6166_320019 [Xanthomonas citri pv. fuscans]|nr:hypothetical protein XFF6166_320019 [Xanthomonas citri pv. fuscans]SOO02863.1 hypothetical protein XFF6960_710010 [Xanthomonas citri pv. fuscans]SOO05535.1 hypothetical protein XFF7767_440010 [Xanthomonas citri pv. fuscans]SOO08739.1 hypothetical protein XFF6970_270062 [Xanthomonas citri pv. fuscans]SOO16789.1 hypothetical protein XFF7766_880003 [Xanthomonas citri pv. fuscans]